MSVTFYITTFIDYFHSKHVLLAHLKGHSHIFTRGFYTALEMPTLLSSLAVGMYMDEQFNERNLNQIFDGICVSD